MKTKRIFLLLVTMLVTAVSWALNIDETNFPDANFRNYIITNYGNTLSYYQISQIEELYLANKNIKSLKGVEYLTALKTLQCSNNQLTSLDVSECKKLQYLYCYNNQLTSLDVSGCTALKSLEYYKNQIKGKAMKALVESLPTTSSCSMLVIYYENEGNVMTTSEVAAANAKGWYPYYANGELNTYGYPIWTIYGGSETHNTYDAEVGGIYYNLIKKAKLAMVTAGDYEYTDNVDIPESFVYEGQTYSVTSISSGAFSGCTGLTSVTIPNSVTSIENAAFSGCSNLTTVFIGSSVETIDAAFENCQELTEVYCYAKNVPTTNSDAFKGSYIGYATLCVPSESMAAYKATAPWSGFGTFKDASNLSINEAIFPDEVFRNYLLSQSYGIDGILTKDEIADVKKIELWYKNVQSLQGIEFFTALEVLNCSNNQLTSLDVSKNTALTSLECGYNQLTSLDVSRNTALTSLKCYNNQLTSLDVSKNTALTSLECSNNKLTSLDVSKNTALTSLSCGGNPFTSLDLSKNTALKELSCSSNSQLTSLIVSGCTALTKLSCGYNKFTSLDVSKNTMLTYLDCSSNKLTSLDVSKNTALETLNCYSNQLTSLDLSKNTALTRLQCYSSKLTSLDLSKNTALTYLSCANNQLTSLDMSKNTALTNISCDNNQLISLNVSGCTALTELSCNNNQLTSLNLYGCTALSRLNCNNNQLTSLNLSGCKALYSLYCFSNKLTSLNVSGCTGLSYMECYLNQITGAAMDAFIESLPTVSNGVMKVLYNKDELNTMTTIQVAAAKAKGWLPRYTTDGYMWSDYDGSEPGAENIYINEKNFPDENFRQYLLGQSYGADGILTAFEIANAVYINVSNRNIKSLQGIEYFTAMATLYCQGNQLTSLDVSGCTALTNLYCYNNQLTTINVSGCTALTYLECYNNQIKGAGMDALVKSLPTVSSGTLRVIAYKNEQNVMTTLQVPAANAKGWKAYYEYSSWGTLEWREYAGSDPDITIDATNFPDEVFRNWVLSQGYGSDGILTKKEITDVTLIKVSGLNIKSLKGIEYFTALLYLHCVGCQLTSLDVSNNVALTILTCSGNQLKSLDVSKNTELTQLWCDGNQITSLDLSENTVLKELWCYSNQLTSLILPKNTSGNKILETVYCYDNKLTSLDASNYGALKNLLCYSNSLTSLDVSNNTALRDLFCYQNQIKGAAMNALVASLPKVDYGYMYVIYKENEGNVMTTTQVTAAKAKGWQPYYYDGSKKVIYNGSEPEAGVSINETNFPDENFCQYLLSQSFGSDGLLTDDEIGGLTKLNVSYKSIKSLKGIEFFTALTYLSCYGNQLTSLDVSKNIALTELICGNNQLTSLDLSKNTALTKLDCYGNQLASLDLSNNIALTELICASNQLTSLDLSKNTGLTTLSCYRNQFASLDLTKNIALKVLNCLGCQLTSLDLSKNTALEVLNCGENQFTSLDLLKNTALTDLNCYGNQLTSLDLSNNMALTYLLCGNNQLTSLDLSKNTALTELYCYSNQLTSLDLSKNTALTTLFCYQNQITGAAMDALLESMPTVKYSYMYVIYNENEGNVMTAKQVAAAKAKGWTPCYLNQSGNLWMEYSGCDVLRGDVNGDGEVNVGDLVSISNFMAGDKTVSRIAADVNQDGEVNVGDLVVISNIMSGNE